MSDVIDTAGLMQVWEAPNKRKLAIKEIRSKLRKVDATDDEIDDALDALIVLAQDKEE
jgi:hypothetical protein